VVAGFIAFTDVPRTMVASGMGALHGTSHWLAAFALTVGGAAIIDEFSRSGWRLC